MATRSMIAIEDNGEVYAIYCHNDGYLEHNGKILLQNYQDVDLVESLIDLGDLSLLGKELGKKQNFNQPTSYDWCLAYGRDRKEIGTAAQKFSTREEAVEHFDGCDYFYLYEVISGEWMYKTYKDKEWNFLSDVFKK